jgi:hypothetical protein
LVGSGNSSKNQLLDLWVMRLVALVSPIWHRYIARLSLAESGLSVARATPLLFDKVHM